MRWVALLAAVAWLSGCPSTGEQRFDTDGDGFEDAQDCGPSDASIHPGAPDSADDDVDQDCDGVSGVDDDGDGYASTASDGPDCNDADPAVHPDAAEVVDNDVDEDCDDEVVHCDLDSDGALSAHPLCGGTDCDDTNGACWLPEHCLDGDGDGQQLCMGDCDDADPARFLGNPELCDGLDNDCNAELPADEADDDGDGVRVCDGDCDDGDDAIFPGAQELCDGLDGDCDGGAPDSDGEGDSDGDGDLDCHDCAPTDEHSDALDRDGDGVTTCDGDCDDLQPTVFPGAADDPTDGLDANCDGVPGVDEDGDTYAAFVADCDDDDPLVHPGAGELCDGVDQDCDGVPSALNGGDEVDGDGDGFLACAECDDASDLRYPGAVELCDGLDTDCDGALTAGDADGDADGDLACDDCDDADPALTTLDVDGDGETSCATDCDDADAVMNTVDLDADGFSPCGGDCSDYNPLVSPAGVEVCNAVDDDCDGVLPDWDQDLDGDGFIGCEDCDDETATAYPGAPELCNGIDEDCDGLVPGDELDGDADGWLSCSAWVGTDPAILGVGDCNPAEASVYPGAPDGCDNLDNDCNGVVDDVLDLDGDGVCAGDCDDTDPDIWPGSWADATVAGQADGVDSNCDGVDPYSVGGASIVITGPQGMGLRLVGDADFDGDGGADLAFTGPGPLGPTTPGEVLVFFGPTPGAALTDADADLVLPGSHVASLGDLDGDGRHELAIPWDGNLHIFTGWTLSQLPADLSAADLTIESNDGDFGHDLLGGRSA
jgi:hypothetical protein